MTDVYAATVQAIISVTNMNAAEITPEKHIYEDLAIDSLDFLDITFEIDRSLGIKLPLEDWMAEGDMDQKLLVKNFVGFVSEVLAGQQAEIDA